MHDNDIGELEELLRVESTGSLKGCRSFLFCSPDSREIATVKKFFHPLDVTSFDLHDWDLDQPCPGQYDVIVACNVFMCAKDPDLWFSNVFSGCKFAIVIDNCIGYRGGTEGETSPSTGDVMRYTTREREAKLPGAYDLKKLSDRIIYGKSYESVSMCGVEGYGTSVRFAYLFRGDKK